MPVIRLPNQGTHQTMTQPINVAIVNQVLSFLNLRNRVKDIRYFSPSGDVRIPNTATGESESEYGSYSGSSRIWVEIDSDMFVDNWITSRPDVIDTKPLFIDQSLGVSIHPFMQSFYSNIKIRFTNHSYDLVRQTREGLTSRIASLQDGMQHTVEFSTSFNEVIIALLNNIWIRRETIAGYGDDFIPYICKHSSERLITTSDASGQKMDMVFKDKMGRVNGYFVVSELPPKSEWQDSDKIWEFTVEYKVNYDLPTEMFVRYPVMVHNQMLSSHWLSFLERNKDIRDSPSKLSTSQYAAALVEFGKAEGNNLVQDFFINIPSFDLYEPTLTPRNTATVFIALLTHDGTTRTPLLNLGDLGNIFIDGDILNCFKKGEYAYLTDLNKSFYYIHLYENDRLMDGPALRVDKDLNVWPTKALDLRKVYRVRFSIQADITTVRKEVFERMWEFPKVVQKTISSINEAVRNRSDFFDMIDKGEWKPWMISPLWMILNGMKSSTQMGGAAFADDYQYLRNNPKYEDSATWGNGYVPSNGNYIELPVEFQVPARILDQARKSNLGMRTVQIQNTIVYRKD